MKKITCRELFLLLVIFFLYQPFLDVSGATCNGQKAFIVVSNHFGPYITASNALEKQLRHKCPGLFVNKIFLDHENDLRDRLGKSAVAVFFPVGTKAATVIHNLFPRTPMVFSMVLDPAPVLRHDPYSYGVVLDIPYGQIVKRLRMLVPNVSRIGILYTDESRGIVNRIINDLDGMDIRFIIIKLDSPEQLHEKLEESFRKADALIAIPDSNIYNSILAPRIIFEAIRHKRPFVGLSKNFTLSGALFSLDCDYKDVGIQAADVGVEILSGRRPEKKIQYPRKFTGYLNMHTARLIGLSPGPKIRKAFRIVAY